MFARLILVVGVLLSTATDSSGYFSNGRWNLTATDGATGPTGTSATVTWSIVPDGTIVPGHGTSNLVAFMDGLYGGGAGPVESRPWFSLVSQSFDRWTELGGLEFVHETADDGVALGNSAGAVSVRGDIRLGGAFLDGIGGTNGQTGFLPNADITFDTGDAPYFGDPANNSINLRNTFMHEIGHALGLGHIDSDTSAFLMEPFSDVSYDGPQMDEVRGLQWLYGDVNERAPAGANDSFGTATPLGVLAAGQTIAIGLDGLTGTTVDPGENDFLSIANQNDVDVFAVELTAGALLSVTATPTGPNYRERITGSGNAFATTRASRASDIALELYGPGMDSPQLLASASSAPLGQAESIADVVAAVPGTYYLRVSAGPGDVQLYHLSATATALGLSGDFDLDDDVDGADFLAWQRGLAPAGPYQPGDLSDWTTGYGTAASPASAVAVPEPASFPLLVTAAIAVVIAQRGRASAQTASRPRTRSW